MATTTVPIAPRLKDYDGRTAEYLEAVDRFIVEVRKDREQWAGEREALTRRAAFVRPTAATTTRS